MLGARHDGIYRKRYECGSRCGNCKCHAINLARQECRYETWWGFGARVDDILVADVVIWIPEAFVVSYRGD